MSSDLGELVDDVLVGGELVRSGFLRRSAVHHLVAEDGRAAGPVEADLALLSLELWYQQARARAAFDAVRAERGGT